MLRGGVAWFLAALLSGCLGGPGEAQGAGASTAADVLHDPEEACLYGRVTDDEVQPVEEASVTVTETRAAVTTNGEGNFRICRLPPGNYTLLVFRPGYLLSVVRVKTLDGTGTVQVVLRPVPQPHIDVRPYSVYHRLGYSTLNVSQASQCGPCAFNFFVPKMPNFVLFEGTWTRSVKVPGLADSMYFDLRAGHPYPGSGVILSGNQPHPVRAVADNETMLKFAAVKAAKDRVPLSGSLWCHNYPCHEQRVTAWISAFYDYAELPAGYTALKAS